MYYSAIGLIAVFVLLIVNQDILLNPKEVYEKPVWKVYRRFLIAVLVYYLTDILWGILDSKKLDKLLFADTTIYFVAMSVGIFLWAQFTIAYLHEETSFGHFIVFTGRLIAGSITILVIANIFYPILFVVTEDCIYKALPVRYGVLVSQILMFILISLYAFTSMFRMKKEEARARRYQILASFGVIMAVLLFIQLLFPLLPVYAIGYMLGTCMLHTFVAADEKEEYKRGLEETEKITVLKDTIVSLLNNMPGMAFTKDAKTGEYLACNNQFLAYANKINSDSIVGLTDSEIFDEETTNHFKETDKVALKLSKPYVYFEDVLDATGNQRQLQTTKLKYRDTSGRLCILGMCQDVTDMVSIQHEHAMTKEAYEQAVSTGLMYSNIAQTLARDYIDMYYINKDTEEYIEYQNGEGDMPLAEIRRGWHFFSDCKKELAEKVYPDDREAFLQAMNRKTLMKALDRKNTFVMTYRQNSENGPVYVNMKISTMDDKSYIIMGITDVDAEMKETMAKNEALSEALQYAERANQAKTTFISGMSHEIRTPLNSIIGLETLALKDNDLNSETRGYLEKIGDSANHLLSVVNDILDMSRIEAGKVVLHKTEFSFGSMLEQLSNMVMGQCRNKGLKYECEVINKVEGLYIGDDMKLKEVLLNILSNAIKYTEAPGDIKLSVEKVAEFENYSTIRFCIKDTGIGMDKDYLPKIFDDYSQEKGTKKTKYGSTGLGMAITKRIVEMMGGSISVKSEKGVGSEFVVTIVLQNAEDQNDSLGRKIDPKNLHILVVDDDPIEAEHARVVLEEVGIKAETCTSGQEALRKMEVGHAKHKPYNLVLMDWNMPGMSGLETSAEVNKLYRNESTIVALTAYNWDDIKEEAESVGVENHLTKPLFAASIIENFERIARRSKMPIFKEKKKAKLAGRRILLAEDVDINAEILVDSLEIEDIKVDHAENGKMALEMFEKSTAGIYAAILMDVRMPVMDGLEATAAIRALDREDAKKIPIIALTANAFDEDVQRSLQAGMNSHLSKPIEAETLIKVLGELIYEAEQ